LKKKLFSEQGRAQLEKIALAPWASRRRQELLELLDRLNPTIEELTPAVEQEATRDSATDDPPGCRSAYSTRLCVDHRSSGSVRAGQADRHVPGMIPSEDSTPVLASNGWDTSVSKAVPCCASFWWRQPKRQRDVIQTGDVGTKALPKWRWPEDSQFGCTGCGGMAVSIRRR
jgi:hypothetical protein